MHSLKKYLEILFLTLSIATLNIEKQVSTRATIVYKNEIK